MDYRNSVFLMLYLPERRITQLPKCLTATSMSAPSLDPKPTMSRLSRAALLIAFFFGLEKALGFVRQVAIARTFGLSATLDVYNAANNLPDLLFALISGGALAIAFIPVLAEYLDQRGRPAMWDLFSRIANLVFLVTAGLSILIAVFSEQLVASRLGIAPGFTVEQQALVAELMRLNLLATLLFSLGGLVIAGLQANQHFLLPAVAPSMYDLGTLFGVLILVPEEGYQLGPITLPAFGMGVYGLVYGTILGAALFLLVQVPGLLRYRFRWVPRIDLRHPGVRQVLRLMGPRILTVLCIQVVFLSQDNIASRLVAGSVSALVYGWLFMQVPETIIGTAVGTALLPTLSEQAARQDRESLHRSLHQALRVLLALTIPVTALLVVVIPPVVGLLGFDQAGSDLVVWTARFFLLGLVGHSLLEISVRAYYAQQNAWLPLAAAAATAVTFVALAAVLGLRFGTPGIGLANTLAFTGQAVVLWLLLNRAMPGVAHVWPTLGRAALGAALAAVLALLVIQFLGSGLIAAVAALALGALAALPFIWPELKLLMKL